MAIEYINNVLTVTNVIKFGTGSVELGTAAAIQDTTKSELYAFDDKDYTFSTWIYLRGTPAGVNQFIFDFRVINKDSDSAPVLYLPIGSVVPHFHNTKPPTAIQAILDSDGNQSGTEEVSDDSNALIVGNTSLSFNTWQHIAVSRKGTTTKLFLDGTKIGEVTQSVKDFFGAKKNIKVGDGLFANLDDVFVARNIGLYDVDFVAPTAEQGNIPQTSLLLTFPSSSPSTPVVSVGTENESSSGVDIAAVVGGLAVIGEITGAVDVCGKSGIVSQISDAQKQLNSIIAEGKNAIYAVESKIAEAKNYIKTLKESPDVIKRSLQEDINNILSEASLADPSGLPARILEVKDAYQDATGAVDRILANVDQFIKDPLNTPLSVCDDIPNITKLGESVSALANNSKMPDFSSVPEDIIKAVQKDFEETIPSFSGTAEELMALGKPETLVRTAPRIALPDVGADKARAGRVTVQQAFNPSPGDAAVAARAVASGTNPSTNAAVAPPPNLDNPFPDGKQFVPEDFEPSKYSSSIASRINTLDPSVRGLFASAIMDYLDNNFADGRDINATECYRSPERSAQLKASGIRAAGAGRSWHNYGAAMDVAIYVNGRWDDGTRGVTEYTGRWRTSLQKFGLINDLSGDSGHAYVASFGAAVPAALRNGSTTVAALAGGSSGLA